MKRPLAYTTAAWCGDDDDNMERAARYCRIVNEAVSYTHLTLPTNREV